MHDAPNPSCSSHKVDGGTASPWTPLAVKGRPQPLKLPHKQSLGVRVEAGCVRGTGKEGWACATALTTLEAFLSGGSLPGLAVIEQLFFKLSSLRSVGAGALQSMCPPGSSDWKDFRRLGAPKVQEWGLPPTILLGASSLLTDSLTVSP
mmetsp:Transcript_6013/g.9553  ORF Transcript_6013/g.9553 Transcript_6013/m.9553 type:complete len:149 (-) Transcript_6013:565-1011(-)